MDPHILERRKEMLRIMSKNPRLQNCITQLREKFPESSEKTLRQDWNRRQKWMPIILNLKDPTLLLEIIAGIQEVVPRAWLVYTQAGRNLNAKIGALRLVADTQINILKALQSIGVIELEPMKLEHELKTTSIDWDSLTDEQQRAIVESARIFIAARGKKPS